MAVLELALLLLVAQVFQEQVAVAVVMEVPPQLELLELDRLVAAMAVQVLLVQMQPVLQGVAVVVVVIFLTAAQAAQES
jgi:hypothetical protein